MESPDGTTAIASLITDNIGVVWSLSSTGKVLRNGSSKYAWNGKQLLWYAHALYLQGNSGAWYALNRDTGGVTATTDPRLAPVPIPAPSPTPTPVPAPGATPDQDFLARRTAAVRWHKFDAGSTIAQFDSAPIAGSNSLGPQTPLMPANSYGWVNTAVEAANPVIDTAVKPSGSGSMRIDILQGSGAAQGYFTLQFSPDGSVQYGAGDKFYVQWRQRFDANYINTVLNALGGGVQYGIKHVTVSTGGNLGMHQDDSMQIVIGEWLQHKMLHAYCDDYSGGSNPLWQSGEGGHPQNAMPGCTYRNAVDNNFVGTAVPPECFALVANEWMTFQFMLDLGPATLTGPIQFGRYVWANAAYKLWGAREGKASVLLIDWNPSTPGYFPLDAGTQASPTKYGKVWLNPQITNKDYAQAHPTMQTWFDELIISRAPINDPMIGLPPSTVVALAPVPAPILVPGTPAWRQGKPVGKFFEILNTSSMNGVAEPYNAYGYAGGHQGYAIDYWNGLAAGPTTWYSAAAGGDGLAQNGVFSVDLAQDAPHWAMNIAPFAGYHATGPYYSDGSPIGRHTYFTTQFISAVHDRNGVDRVMLLSDRAAYGVNGKDGGFSGGPQVDGFRIAAGKWDAAGTWKDIAYLDSPPMSFAKHPLTEDVYFSGGYKWWTWHPATDTYRQITPQFLGDAIALSWSDLPSLVDPTRGVAGSFVCMHNKRPYATDSQRVLQVLDIAANTIRNIVVTGALNQMGVVQGGSLVHDRDNDRYILFWGHNSDDKANVVAADSTTDVYAINPDTGVSTYITNINVVLPASEYNHAAYFQALGGVVYLPRFSSNILFMPTR